MCSIARPVAPYSECAGFMPGLVCFRSPAMCPKSHPMTADGHGYGPSSLYHREQTVQLDTMLPGDRIDDQLLWPDALAVGAYRLAITEDGSGRHGEAFTTTAHLGRRFVH
jgi:hypothetical protein